MILKIITVFFWCTNPFPNIPTLRPFALLLPQLTVGICLAAIPFLFGPLIVRSSSGFLFQLTISFANCCTKLCPDGHIPLNETILRIRLAGLDQNSP